jgi:hypothetical protein
MKPEYAPDSDRCRAYQYKGELDRETLWMLRRPFMPDDHKDRRLPGGGQWFYLPWQKIRRRVFEVAPDSEISFAMPAYLGEYCVIICNLTIAGVTRQGVGNAEIELISSNGKDMSRGSPIERATADAWKNAAEQFGVGAYLDDQKFVCDNVLGGRAYQATRNGKR